MAYKNEGLPGIYRRKREQQVIISAPNGVRMNSWKISRLEERITELEKKVFKLEKL